MKAQCKKCGTWFKITPELEELIMEGVIYAPDINLCPMCAELSEEQAQFEEYMYNTIDELLN